jgi:small subunit ribosomal protein S17
MARKLVGTVVSDVQNKTIVVAVNRSVTHPLYGKRYTVTKKYAAHDESNKAHAGDTVEITETRPISKNKTFKLSKIVETGHAEIEVKGEELIADTEQQRREAKEAEEAAKIAEVTEVKKPKAKKEGKE